MQKFETTFIINRYLTALLVGCLLAVLPGCMGEYRLSPEEAPPFIPGFEVGHRYRLEEDIFFNESDSRYYEYFVRLPNHMPPWPPSAEEYRRRPEQFGWVDLALEEGTVVRVTGVSIRYSPAGTYPKIIAEVEGDPHAGTYVELSLITERELDKSDEGLERTYGTYHVRDPAYLTPVPAEAEGEAGSDGDAKAEAAEKVRQIGASQLHADAELFRKRQAEGKAPPAPSDWPENFRQLNPVQVKSFMFGVLLVIEESDGKECGIYIVTEPTGNPPHDGSGIVSERIGRGVYWVEQKIRRPIRRRAQ